MAKEDSLPVCVSSFDLLSEIRSDVNPPALGLGPGERRRLLWQQVSRRVLLPMLQAARQYAERRHGVPANSEEAAGQVFLAFIEVVQDPAGAPFPADDAAILAQLVQQTERAVNTANRRAARQAEEPLPSGDRLLARGPSPAEEVESRDFVASLIRKVDATVGEECAVCFELRSLGYNAVEIAEKLRYQGGPSTETWPGPPSWPAGICNPKNAPIEARFQGFLGILDKSWHKRVELCPYMDRGLSRRQRRGCQPAWRRDVQGPR